MVEFNESFTDSVSYDRVRKIIILINLNGMIIITNLCISILTENIFRNLIPFYRFQLKILMSINEDYIFISS